MDIKKESPQTSGERQTGGKGTYKGTKRKRTKQAVLVSKWIPPLEVLTLEGGRNERQ